MIPTSEAQREVWLADKLSSQASRAFNESVSLDLCGSMDQSSLIDALHALVKRHESLRGTFNPDGTEQLVSADPLMDIPTFDLRSLDEANVQSILTRAVEQAVEGRFDLEHGPLFRASLYRLSDDRHRLLMTAHHIICDGWSWGVIVKDLGSLYAEKLGLAPGLDAASNYGDYVAWEATESRSEAMREHERFWLRQFTGTLPVLDLPTDRPRAAVRTFNSRRLDHQLDLDLTSALRSTGAKLGASNFATLFSGFASVLHRLTAQDDLVIGVPAAGQSASAMTDLVGHCVNLLPVRAFIDPSQSFGALLQRLSGELLDAFEHQTLTFGTLLKKLPAQRDPSRLPLVSVMFNLDQPVSVGTESYPDLQVTVAANPRHYENFELFVNIVPTDSGLRIECQYNSDLFDAITVERWLRAYEALLRAAVLDPAQAIGSLNWVAPGDMAVLQALQPGPTPLSATELMHTAIEGQCRETPTRIALSDGVSVLTYAELDQRSNRLAHALVARGVRSGDRVGLCVSRGTDMVVALLAVLKAGGAYVPLDPSFPAERLAFYAEDSRLALLLLDAGGVASAPTSWRSDAAQRVFRIDTDGTWSQQPSDALRPAPQVDPASAAYIIYTSGSTGKPKGVCVPHRAVVNFLASMRRDIALGGDDRLAAVTTLSFDIAVLELMLPLTQGAQVVIVPREVSMDGGRLSELLRINGVTAMQATPSFWRLLLDTPWRGPNGFKALVGGEACSPDLGLELLSRVDHVWNMYGPTETTIWSTMWSMERSALSDRGMSIGRPIANTSVWILDANRQPCPPGVPGEICIGGAGVALGYLDRPELTQDRFFTAPFLNTTDSRIYRTGDRGRWRNDGLLQHLGRLDFQVKVRGYRIELGEIESLCNEFAGVNQSVVLAREDVPNDVRLVAYVVPAMGMSFDEASLRTHLRKKIPDYMQPQHVVVLENIPLLPNGKIDRKALPAPDVHRMSTASERVAPRDDVERRITATMETVLNLPGLGIRDDFFALGGHSLLAARFTSQVNRDYELNLPLTTLFQAPTAEKFSSAVRAAMASGVAKRPPLKNDANRRSAPLTPMQDRMRFVEELSPGRLLYNTPSAHRLTGKMDVAKFEQALREIIRRQPSLRTRIGPNPTGQGHLQWIESSIAFDLPLEDLSTLAGAERETELLSRMQRIVDTPLDIYRAPLFRAALYRLAPDQHAFFFMPHHIIWDGWSFDILYEEMAAIYGSLVEARPIPLPPLAVTYGDYAEWYGEWMRSDEFGQQLRYWKERFANAPLPASPRLDKPRRAGMTGEGATEWVQIDRELTERLRDIARGADVTLNMLTLAIYTAMMTSVVGGSSIVIGLPVRGRLMAEVEPVMGFFNNLLPVQFRVDEAGTAIDFVKQVRRELMEVLANQDVPFERLAAEPEVAALSQKVGLYQALFSFQDARGRKRQWGPLEHRSILIFQKGATEDLGLWLMELSNGLEGGFTYNADIYNAETAKAFRERYLELLRLFVENPSFTIGQLTATKESASARYLVERDAPRETQPEDMPVRSSSAAAETSKDAAVATLSRPSPVASELSPTEAEMTKVWKDLLGRADIRPTDNFFDVGGYSLLAMTLLARLEIRFGKKISPAMLLEAPTIRQLSSSIDQTAGLSSLVRIRPGGDRPAIFFVHDADGEVLLYRNLASRLDVGHAVYGLQPYAGEGYAMRHTRMADIVEYYLEKVRSVQAHGPYVLGGLCAGGMIAFEIALRLQEIGEHVSSVVLIDAAEVSAAKKVGLVTKRRMTRIRESLSSRSSGPVSLFGAAAVVAKKVVHALSYEVGKYTKAAVLRRKVKALQRALARNAAPPHYARTLTVREILTHAEADMKSTQRFRGNVLLLRATRRLGETTDEPFMERFQDSLLGWGTRVEGDVSVIDIPAGHSTMLQEPHVAQVAEKLQAYIDAAS